MLGILCPKKSLPNAFSRGKREFHRLVSQSIKFLVFFLFQRQIDLLLLNLHIHINKIAIRLREENT